MSVLSWIIPQTNIAGAAPVSPGSGFSFVPAGLLQLTATPSSDLVGQQDQLLDPITLDYVRTTVGDWAQTADSRTIMLIALSVRLGQSAFDPADGTTIYELMRAGDLVTPEVLQSETLRVGQILAAEGILTGLLVAVRGADGNPLKDQSGRNVVNAHWRDLASGSPINQTFAPR